MGKVRIEGLRELERALAELPKATGKNVLRRVAVRALEPVMEAARARAPVDKGTLKESLNVSTKLSKRQQRLNARRVAQSKASVELYAGPTALPHAHLVEFGTVKMAPQPFMRPAWDATKNKALEIIKSELGSEIDKAAKRLARKRARAAAKG